MSAAIGYRDGGIGGGGRLFIAVKGDSRKGEVDVWEIMLDACGGLAWVGIVDVGDTASCPPMFLPALSCCCACAAAAAASCSRRRYLHNRLL